MVTFMETLVVHEKDELQLHNKYHLNQFSLSLSFAISFFPKEWVSELVSGSHLLMWYSIIQSAPLFNSIKFLLHGEFTSPTRTELKKLIVYGGGTRHLIWISESF